MTAVEREQWVDKGATWRIHLRLKKNGSYLALTGYTGRLGVRKTIQSDTMELESLVGEWTFDNAGRAYVDVAASRTATVTIPNGVYALEIESPSGEVDRLLQGPVHFEPNPARPNGDPP